MKPSPRLVLILFFLFILLGACGRQNPVGEPTPAPSTTATLPPPKVNTTQAPDAENTARAYLSAWGSGDMAGMYALLAPSSQAAISEEEFASRYNNVAMETAMDRVDTQIFAAVTKTHSAQISYHVNLQSNLVGELHGDTNMNLVLENGQWRVEWDPALILPQLSDGDLLRMDYQIPSRGDIFDRDGQALVAQSDAVALGMIPDQIDPDSAEGLFSELSRLTGIRTERIQELYEETPAGSGWYVALSSVPAEVYQQREGVLANYSGWAARPYTARYYFGGGIAPHVVGYVSPIQEDEAERFRRLGYRIDQKVGRIGLESWGENYLSGKRGGDLYVVDPEGLVVEQLASVASGPAQSIYTTIDRNLQVQAQQALVGFRGAVVVLERDTGRVLAMASSPGFDPNLFEPENFNRGFQIQDLFDQQSIPLLNRATQGQYPLGSVFKIVTMAAALESGLYTADTVYDCQQTFTELQGVTLYDWTLEKELPPSGLLTLPEGLMRSCNTYFYHIGLDLFNQGKTTAISDMARGFGLGSPTGIQQLAEESGQVPDPGSKLYATSLAIGQADLQVTPLQVARFIAAVGNGGTLYRPQVVDRIGQEDGDTVLSFQPEVQGELPVSQQNLEIIQNAMVSVVANRRGTAYPAFLNLRVPLAGKTGTAQDPPRDPHAWFAGYTFANRQDLPDIAVAVVVENAGEGSEIAAPIFRRVIESYFLGRPIRLYPWESQIGVTRTPTPEGEETPSPED
jgi:penicillin-binding protein 2